MRILKFLALWLILAVVMVVSWAIGFGVGNAVTGAGTPPPTGVNPATTLAILAGVCLVNTLLLSFPFWNVTGYRGLMKWISLLLFPFMLQFFLTQMETWFFAASVGIGLRQIMSILIAGACVAAATVSIGLWVSRRFNPHEPAVTFRIKIPGWRPLLLRAAFLIFAGYPILYIVFGYFVAWQSEEVRLYYSGSVELNCFFHQLADFFSSGLYFFQVFRALLWVAVTLPVVQMLHGSRRYLLIGVLTALLPSSLLFIPNPYMPASVAHMHFVEVSLSNFVWGILMAFVLGSYSSRKPSPFVTTAPSA